MPTLNAALAELTQALDLLDQAATLRAQADQRIAALEQELSAVLEERNQLQQQLEAANSRPPAKAKSVAPQQLELIESKIDGAIDNIESVLANKSNAA